MALFDHLEKLKYIVQVGRHGSLREAAAKLHTTQPNVSYNVAVLEQALEKTLLIRTPGGSRLTADGITLFKFAESIFEGVMDFEQVFKKRTNTQIVIGSPETINSYFWNSCFILIKRFAPALDIQILTGSVQVQKQRLEQGILDALILTEGSLKGFNRKFLFDDYYSFYGSKNLPRSVADLKNERLAYVPFSPISGGKNLKIFLEAKNFHPKAYMEFDSFLGALEFVRSNSGIAILPNRLGAGFESLDIKRLRPQKNISESFGKHSFSIIYNERPEVKLLASVLEKFER